MAERKKVNYKVFNAATIGAGDIAIPDKKVVKTDSFKVDANDKLLLQRACSYWNALGDFRTRRERNRRYYRGDQWGDKVYDPDSETYVSEESLIKSHGKVPLKQNQIRQLIKNLIGQFLSDSTKAAVVSHKRSDQTVAEMLTNTIQYGLQVNRSREMDTRNFEEFLLSGAAVWKSLYKFVDKFQREEVWIENRPLTNMFFTPNIRDIRLTDMDLIGEFHDLYLKDIVASFAKDEEDEQRIKDIYGHVMSPNDVGNISGMALSSYYSENQDFYIPREPDKGRVFEIWERQCGWRLRCHDWLNAKSFVAEIKDKKIIDRENMQRLQDAAIQGVDPKIIPLITYTQRYQRFWYVKYMSWQGTVLHEQETPYEHKEHPYTSLLYPLVDGEVWGFVEDIIDQQRYVNRLVTLLDFIIGSSAKGVLLVPEDSISDDFDLDQISEAWTKFNGVIKIKLKPGAQIPQQISANSTNVGIHELLSLQLRFMSEISGVSGPIQGQQSASGTPASLYAQETQNSTLNSKDYFEAFNSARTERDWKALKVQIQFYDDDRNLALSGVTYNTDALTFKQSRAAEVEFDMVMSRTPDSPVYRALVESSLEKFVGAQYIDFETYLKNSSLPFADNLLNDIQTKKKQLAEQGGGVPPPLVDPKMAGQVTQHLQGLGADASQANPKALAMASKYMQGLDKLN
jgi:hypothetical protein